MSERSEIQWGLTPIPFTVRRSDKRTTVALTIDQGRLIVTAPVDTPLARLHDVVRHKATWIAPRLRPVKERPQAPTAREFVDGESVLYRGGHYRLKVLETPEEPYGRIWAGWYEVHIAPGLVGEPRRLEVRRCLAGSLKQHADLALPNVLGDVCKRLRLEPPGLIVRDQNKRWGSCDARGVLRLNWRIIQAPAALIEYVLVHELAHLVHPKHGAEFWATVGRYLPGYGDARARLKELGPRLVW